jgi:hypothetical protein
VVIAMFATPRWTPPGVDPSEWRLALAEDVCDVLAQLAQTEPAIAVAQADAVSMRQIGWPGLLRYEVPALDVRSVLDAAAADGFEQAALVAGDAPDVPGMVIAKLLRPLTTRPVSVAVATQIAPAGDAGAGGLLGLGSTLPAPRWLPALSLDDLTPQVLREAAPKPGAVARANGWHRLRSAPDLAALDPRLEGWDNTRALLPSRP